MTPKPKSNATVFEALKWASLCLTDHDLEAEDAKLLMMSLNNWDFTQLVNHYQEPLKNQTDFEYDLEEVISGKPVQYVTNQANFYGYQFYVAPGVLIPRPETEELVDWILMDQPSDSIKVLDIGTGSGAIAIALAKQRPNWDITASDISKTALKIAKKNAETNDAKIKFVWSDLFSELSAEKYDLIVCNPPYIAKNETKYMDQSVLDYEPKEALFVADDGLAIYERLAKEINNHLEQNGQLYLEIGFKQGKAVTNLLKKNNPNKKIKLKKDLADHDRMIKMG